MTDTATNEPLQAYAGDTWAWVRTFDDYPAGSGWTLRYRFKNSDGGFAFDATASGDDHAVTVAAATTGGYAAGVYDWQAWVESGSEKYTVDTGTLEVLADLRGGTDTAAYDKRTYARKMLDAIEAKLEGRATADQEEYTIMGRSLKRIPITELDGLRKRYQAEVAGELASEKLDNGIAPRKIVFKL